MLEGSSREEDQGLPKSERVLTETVFQENEKFGECSVKTVFKENEKFGRRKFF